MIAKTDTDKEQLRMAGTILAEVLRELASQTQAGVTTAQLDLVAEDLIRAADAVPAFLNYKPSGAKFPYPAVLCISVNDEVVHGIPTTEHVLKEGDLVSLDLGLSYRGYFVDSARTLFVGAGDPAGQKLLDGTREALSAAINAAQVGGHIGDIGAAVEAVAQRYSLAVVDELGGHAVGKSVHEMPFIGNVGERGEGKLLTEGLVLALEPIFAEGDGEISLLEDEWTYATRDGTRAAHFEQTIILTKTGPEILTPFV
jgi:methionyl aminopeptidase